MVVVVSYTTLSLGTTAIKGSMRYGLIVPVRSHTRCCTTTITCPTSLLSFLVQDADERYIRSDFSNVQTSEKKLVPWGQGLLIDEFQHSSSLLLQKEGAHNTCHKHISLTEGEGAYSHSFPAGPDRVLSHTHHTQLEGLPHPTGIPHTLLRRWSHKSDG